MWFFMRYVWCETTIISWSVWEENPIKDQVIISREWRVLPMDFALSSDIVGFLGCKRSKILLTIKFWCANFVSGRTLKPQFLYRSGFSVNKNGKPLSYYYVKSKRICLMGFYRRGFESEKQFFRNCSFLPLHNSNFVQLFTILTTKKFLHKDFLFRKLKNCPKFFEHRFFFSKKQLLQRCVGSILPAHFFCPKNCQDKVR